MVDSQWLIHANTVDRHRTTDDSEYKNDNVFADFGRGLWSVDRRLLNVYFAFFFRLFTFSPLLFKIYFVHKEQISIFASQSSLKYARMAE